MLIDWPAFTPYSALIGGVLIGLASAMLIMCVGRVAGISGIVGGLFSGQHHEAWRWYFLMGLLIAPWLYQLFAVLPPMQTNVSCSRRWSAAIDSISGSLCTSTTAISCCCAIRISFAAVQPRA